MQFLVTLRVANGDLPCERNRPPTKCYLLNGVRSRRDELVLISWFLETKETKETHSSLFIRKIFNVFLFERSSVRQLFLVKKYLLKNS